MSIIADNEYVSTYNDETIPAGYRLKNVEFLSSQTGRKIAEIILTDPNFAHLRSRLSTWLSENADRVADHNPEEDDAQSAWVKLGIPNILKGYLITTASAYGVNLGSTQTVSSSQQSPISENPGQETNNWFGIAIAAIFIGLLVIKR